MGLIIKEVSIKNFRSHVDTKVIFDSGINLIVGRNGAGKSSILDAILVALYGSRPTGMKKEYLIRNGTQRFSITLKFEMDGKEFVLQRNSDGTSILRGDGVLIEGDSQISYWIERNFGSAHIFTGAIYVRQGEIDAIIRDEESRERVIRKVTRIEDFENAWKNLGSIISSFERERDFLRNFAEQQRGYEDLKVEKERELDEKKKELNASIDILERLEREVEMLRKRKEEFDEVNKRLSNLTLEEEKLLGDKRALEAQRLSLTSTIKQIREKIKELEKDVERYSELLDKALTYEKLEKLYEDVLRKLREFEQRINKLRQDERKIESDYARSKEDLNKLKEVQAKVLELEKEVSELRPKAEKWDEIRGKISRKEEILAKLRASGYSPEKIKNMYEKIQKIKEEYKKLQDIAEKLAAKISEGYTKKRQLQNALKTLEESTVCPLCRRELSMEHKNKLVRSYKEEIGIVEKEVLELKNKKDKLEERRKLIETALKKEEKVLRLKQLLDELYKLESELSSLDLREVERVWNKYEELMTVIQKHKGAILTLKKSAEMVENLEAELKKVQSVIQKLEDERKEVLNKLEEAGYKSLEELEKAISSLKQDYIEWQRVKDAKVKLESEKKLLSEKILEVDNVEKLIEEKNKEISRIKLEIQKLLQKYDEEEHRKVSNDLLKKSNELSALKQKIKGLRDSISSLERDLTKIYETLHKIKEYKKRAEIIDNKVLPELKKIREKFRQYKNTLMEAVFKEVEEYASEIFEEFTEGKYGGIKLKQVSERGREKLKVFIIYQGEERDLSFLSGGELIALALAFRLALSMFMVKGRIPLLMLDEPTPFLDEERRRKLVDITTSYLRRIPQVIIVSHDEELKDAADKVINVEFIAGSSKVRA